MKIYKREIKPYISSASFQGCNWGGPAVVEGYDWVDEDQEEKIKQEIVVSDPPWEKLIFKERYVVVGETWPMDKKG